MQTKLETLPVEFLKLDPSLFLGQQDQVFNVKDGNTLASILNHEGVPLSQLRQGKYSIYNQDTQANDSQIKPLLEDIQKDVSQL